ncbi:MAG: DUF3638 domain-containing protein, partial [Chlamydiales bacterium]|nr:DUF3638 domain-containing protein [Chlamydiales bacterium]
MSIKLFTKCQTDSLRDVEVEKAATQDVLRVQRSVDGRFATPSPSMSDVSDINIFSFDPEECKRRYEDMRVLYEEVAPPDEAIFPLIHGDSFIKGTEFEGVSLSKNIDYLKNILTFLQEKGFLSFQAIPGKPDVMNSLMVKYGQIQSWNDRIRDCSTTAKRRELSEELMREVGLLQPGTSLALPGGYGGSSGHYMIYEFTKKENGNYRLTVINTGDGLENHAMRIDGYKNKRHPIMVFDEIDSRLLFATDINLFYSMLLPRINPEGKEFSGDIVYTTVFDLFSDKLVKDDLKEREYITGQRSGTCSWKVLLALLRMETEPSLYKKAVILIKQASLVSFYEKNQRLLEEDSVQAQQMRRIVKEGVKDLLRAVSKGLRKEGIVDSEASKDTLAAMEHILLSLQQIEEDIYARRKSTLECCHVADLDTSNLPELNVWSNPVAEVEPLPPYESIASISNYIEETRDPKQLGDVMIRCLELAKEYYKRYPGWIAREQVQALVRALPIPVSSNQAYYDNLTQAEIENILHQLLELFRFYTSFYQQGGSSDFERNTIMSMYAILHYLCQRWETLAPNGSVPQISRDFAYSYNLSEEELENAGNRRSKKTSIHQNTSHLFFCPDEYDKMLQLKEYFDHQRSTFSDMFNEGFNYSVPLSNQQDLEGALPTILYKVVQERKRELLDVYNGSRRTMSWKDAKGKAASQESCLLVELLRDVRPFDQSIFKTLGWVHLYFLRQAHHIINYLQMSETEKVSLDRYDGLEPVDTSFYDGDFIVGAGRLDYSKGWKYFLESRIENRQVYNSYISRGVMNDIPRRNIFQRGVDKLEDGDTEENFEAFVLLSKQQKCDFFYHPSSVDELRPIELLYEGLYHIEAFKEEQFRCAFENQLFKSVIRSRDGGYEVLGPFDSEIKLPEFQEAFIQFIQQGKSTFAQNINSESLPIVLEFIKYAILLIPFAKRAGEDVFAQRLEEGIGEIDRWLQIPELEKKDRYVLHLHRALFLLGKNQYRQTIESSSSSSSSNGSSLEEKINLLQSYLFIQSKAGANWDTDYLEKMVCYVGSRFLSSEDFDPSDIQDALPGIIEDVFHIRMSGNKTIERQSSFVFQIRDSDGDGDVFTIDLYTGVLLQNGELINDTVDKKKIIDDEQYRAIFGDRLQEFRLVGSWICFEDEKFGKFRVLASSLGKRDDSYRTLPIVLQKNIHGKWCTAINKGAVAQKYHVALEGTPSSYHWTGDIPLSVITDHTHWIGEDGIYICDQSTQKVKYGILDGHSGICIFNDQDTLEEIGSLEPLHRTAFAETNAHIDNPLFIVKEKKGSDIFVTFTRYKNEDGSPLTFQRTQDGLVLVHDRHYRLKEDVSQSILDHFESFLVLEHMESNKLVALVPNVNYYNSEKRPVPGLAHGAQLDVADANLEPKEFDDYIEEKRALSRTYTMIPLKGDHFDPVTTEQLLSAAFIMLGQRKYQEVVVFLTQISACELDGQGGVLDMLVQLPERLKDFSPPVIAIKMREQYLLNKQSMLKGDENDDDRDMRLKKLLLCYQEYLGQLGNIEEKYRLSLAEEHFLLSIYENIPPLEEDNFSLPILSNRRKILSGEMTSLPFINGKEAHSYVKEEIELEDIIHKLCHMQAVDLGNIPLSLDLISLNEELHKRYNKEERFYILYDLVQKSLQNKERRKQLIYIFSNHLKQTNIPHDKEESSYREIVFLLGILLSSVKLPFPDFITWTGEYFNDWVSIVMRHYSFKEKDTLCLSGIYHHGNDEEEGESTLNVHHLIPIESRLKESPRLALHCGWITREPDWVSSLENAKEWLLGNKESGFRATYTVGVIDAEADLLQLSVPLTEQESDSYRSGIEQEIAAFSQGYREIAANDNKFKFPCLSRLQIEEEAQKLKDWERDACDDVQGLERELLELANRKVGDESIDISCSLSVVAGNRKELTIPDLVFFFSLGNAEAFHQANQALSNENIQELYDKTGVYLHRSIEAKQIQRMASAYHTLAADMEKDGMNSTDQVMDEALGIVSNITVVKDLEDLIGIATQSINYTIEEYPQFLVFEYTTGLMFRKDPDQAKILEGLLGVNRGNKIAQVRMGEGKTSIFAPNTLQVTISKGKIPILITPSFQYRSLFEQLKKTLHDAFHMKIETFDYARKDLTLPVLTNILKTLKDIQESNRFLSPTALLVCPETLQIIELEYFSLLRDWFLLPKEHPANATDGLQQKLNVLREIFQLLKKDGVAFSDEMHTILDILKEINFPLGDDKAVDPKHVRLASDILSIIQKGRALFTKEECEALHLPMEGDSSEYEYAFADIIKIQDNRQCYFSCSLFTRYLVPKIAKILVKKQYLKLDTEKERKGFERYSSGQIRGEIQEAIEGELKGEDWTTVDREDLEFVQRLRNGLAKSQDNEAKKAADLIALSRHILCDMLPFVLTKVGNANFGRSRKKEETGKVIPFICADTPSQNEFGYHYEAILYQLLTSVIAGVDDKQILDFFDEYHKQAIWFFKNKHIPYEQTPPAKACMSYFGVLPRDIVKELEAVKAQLKEDCAKRFIIEQVTIDKYVRYHEEMLNGNAIGLVSMLGEFNGFSGTPDPLIMDLSLQREGNNILNGTVNPEVVSAIVTKQTKVVVTANDEPEAFFRECFKQLSVDDWHRVSGMLDIGAVFKNHDNIHIARMFLEVLQEVSEKTGKPAIDAVIVFCRRNGSSIADYPAIIRRGMAEPEFIRDTTEHELRKHGLTPGRYFIFYDKRHCTGADVKQLPDAINISSYDPIVSLSDATQGWMRMRQLLKGQQIVMGIPIYAAESMPSVVPGKTFIELVQGCDAGDPQTSKDVLLSIIHQAIVMEVHQRSNKMVKAFTRMLGNAAREEAKKAFMELEACADNEDLLKKLVSGFYPALYTPMEDEPYRDLGSLQKPVPIMDSLRLTQKSILDALEDSLSKAGVTDKEEILGRIRDKQEEILAHAENIQERFVQHLLLSVEKKADCAAQAGMEMEVARQVQQEVQNEVDMNLEQELQLELESMQSKRKLHPVGNPFNAAIFLTTLRKQLGGEAVDPIANKMCEAFSSPRYKKPYGKIFHSHLMATEDFLHPYEENITIFDQKMRPFEYILIVKESDTHSGVIVSQYQAKKLKEYIRDNHLKDVWLAMPNGELQAGDITNFDITDSEVGRIFTEMSILSPNTDYLLQHMNEYVVWLDTRVSSKEDLTALKQRFLKLRAEADQSHKPIIYRYLLQRDVLENILGQEDEATSMLEDLSASAEDMMPIRDDDIENTRGRGVRRLTVEQIAKLTIHHKESIKHLNTPGQIKALPNDLVPYLEASQMRYIQVSQVPYVTRDDCIRAIPGESIAMLTAEHVPESMLRSFTDDQYRQIKDPALLQKVPRIKIQYIDPEMTPHLGLMDPSLLLGLSDNQLAYASDAQWEHIIAAQADSMFAVKVKKRFQQIVTEELIVRLPPPCLSLLNQRSLKCLSPSQVQSVVVDFPLLQRLPQECVPHFTLEQMKHMAQEQIRHITQEQVKLLRIEDLEVIRKLSGTQLAKLDSDVLQAIDDEEIIQKIPDDALLTLLTDEQLAYLSDKQITSMEDEELIRRLPKTCFGAITDNQYKHLSEEQVKLLRIEDLEVIRKLSGTQLAKLDSDVLQAIDNEEI